MKKLNEELSRPEGEKLHARFDEGDTDSWLKFVTFKAYNLSELLGFTLWHQLKIAEHKF